MALSPVRLRASMSVGSSDTIAFTRSNSPALIASMKAALLDVVSGIMPRFYRFVAAVVVSSVAAAASAQTPQTQTSRERPPLGAIITVGPLGLLPTAANL